MADRDASGVVSPPPPTPSPTPNRSNPLRPRPAIPWRLPSPSAAGSKTIRSLFRPGVRADLGFAAVLLGLLWAAYAPSLGHTPRADHWDFLVETMDQDSFLEVFARTCSYNRTRQVAPGDTELYRPLLFAVLAAEKTLFRLHFDRYQAAGVVLHWAVACLLLLLLKAVGAFVSGTDPAGRQRPPWVSRLLPYAVCLFFALNKSVVELVVWSHLHGYLLFLICLLGSLTLLLGYALHAPTWRSPRLWGSWVLALLAAFTYELGQVYAVLAGLFLAGALPRGAPARRRWALAGLFAAVAVLYQGADLLDRRIHQGQFDEDVRGKILLGAFAKRTVPNSLRCLSFTAIQPFFPSLWAGALDKGHLRIDEADWPEHLVRFWRPCLAVSLVTTVLAWALGLSGLARLVRRSDRRSFCLFLLAAGLYGAYLASIVLGRLNRRPEEYLSLNSYYAHMGLLLALVPAFAAWRAAERSRRAAVCQAALLVGLAALSCYSAPAVRGLNTSVARDLGEWRDGGPGFARWVAALDGFIRQHRGEADFSLGFDIEACDTPGTHHGVPVTTILFKRYITWSRPKYMMTFPGGEPCLMGYEEWLRTRGPKGCLCPELVSVGTHYNYFRVDGWYYGVQTWDGCYDSRRRDHAYLVRDRTLEGAMDQASALLDEQDGYVHGAWLLPPFSPVSPAGRWARGVQAGPGPRQECLRPLWRRAFGLGRPCHDHSHDVWVARREW